MKILIVDDEIDLCLLLKSYFTKKGYEVTLAYTLASGLDNLRSIVPDVLFLDNNLADGLGWPMVPAILRASPQLKIFLISAYHPPLPPLPAGSHVKVIEKPISFANLDEHMVILNGNHQ